MYYPYYFAGHQQLGYGYPFPISPMPDSFSNSYYPLPYSPFPQDALTPYPRCHTEADSDTESPTSSSPACHYQCHCYHHWHQQEQKQPEDSPNQQQPHQARYQGPSPHIPSGYAHIRVWNSTIEPWQLPPNTPITHSSHTVRCSTTLEELLDLLNANNKDPSRNKCVEMSYSNRGRWQKNWEFSGSDQAMMQRTLSDIGWDRAHLGAVGDELVVNVWVKRS
ncbi:hypothetical protein CFIMG_008335RA00001 [Ceratocystis fimbriata CBS 114723]|uniref:Uncharacterized protein n=1 Tax=Ceratocystis fimbriata CBS 114723 TaxID=1035309 RepID=A0A2C5X4B2_9PEZI|nr:hypothetical protein CFIMG_008335RA00001 [Ceratocystis fimbriata CBS 114723]